MATSGERASVFQTVKVAPETTPGTAMTTGFKKLTALGFTPTINPTINSFKPAGQKYTTVTTLNKEDSTWAIDGVPTFTEIVYPLSSVLTEAEITAAGGNTSAASGARVMGADGTHWFFKPSAGDADSPKSYTIFKGSVVGAERATYLRIGDFTLTYNRNDTTLGGSGMARALEASAIDTSIHMPGNEIVQVAVNATGGTYTLTFGGATTGNIDFDATETEVLTALEALSTIPTGSLRVEQTVAASPAFTYLIEFGGSLGETNVGNVTASDLLTGGTSDVTITVPTTGAAVSSIELVPVLPTQVCIYAYSSAQADISDTTNETDAYKLTDVMEVSLTISGRYGPYYTLDCSQDSFATLIELTPTMQLMVKMQANTEGLAYLTQLRSGGTVFFRVKAEGATISSVEPYELTFDFAGKISAASDLSDSDGVYAVSWTFDAVPELTNGGPLEIAVVNDVTAL
jgi:hypothetical protein